MRHRLPSILLAALIAATGLIVPGIAAPPPSAAAEPSPTSRMQVRFEAGTHRGYRFDLSTGAILGSKRATLERPSSAATEERRTIPGRGIHLRIVNGIWAGYWIPESIVSHVRGIVGEVAFSQNRTIQFPPGRTLGYRFDEGWNLIDARVASFSRPSSAAGSMMATIDGIPYIHISNGALANRWAPAAGSGATRPLDCRTGARASGGAAVWSQVAGAGPEVALTFDLGGRTEPALAIVKRLLLNGVCTTVFPTGDIAATAAGQEVLEFIDDYPTVFELGNHTQDHCDLVRGGGGAGCPAGRPSASFVRSQLTTANTAIHGVTGQTTTPYWRPPYGAQDAGVRSAAAAAGYSKTVMWHIDTIDWKPPPPTDTGPTTVQLIARVAPNVGNGSIVLAHLGGWNTHAALPMIIHGVRARGLVPTSISDLVDGN